MKQMVVRLDKKILEDRGVIIPDYFFWSYPPVVTVLLLALYTIEAILLCISVYFALAILLQPLIICATVSACGNNLHLESCTVR